MKRIKIIIILALLFLTTPVHAANYEMKELIPVKTTTTIVTNKLSYKNFYYDNKKIVFDRIKNLTNESTPITISIGLFNSKKKNIGVINHCDYTIKPKEEINYEIDVTKDYLGKDYKLEDIKYIAILSDNKDCRTSGHDEFIGQTIKEMGQYKNRELDSNSKLFINIMTVIGGVLLLLFIYKFLFTRSFQNFDGEDVRQGYERVNEDLKKEREEELRKNPPQPKEIKSDKSIEVLEQEKEAANEDKSSTDLHNLYK